MSLEFLSKKSWHTKNLGNQEKVWLAEQRALQEESRVQELQRQIQLDRELEEMNRITGQEKKKGSIDKGIDWMYSEGGGMKAEEDWNEEFLLGKKFTNRDFLQQEATSNDKTKHEGKMDIIIDSAAEKKTSPTLHSSDTQKRFASNDKNQVQRYTNDDDDAMARNREFHLRYEDPMHMVSMRRKEMENKLLKKKELYERVSGSMAVISSNREEAHRVLGQNSNAEINTDKCDRQPREDRGKGRSRSLSKEKRMERRRSGQKKKKKKHRSRSREMESSGHGGSSSSSIGTRDRHRKRRYRGQKHRPSKDIDYSESDSSGYGHIKHRRREVRQHKEKRHKRHHRSQSDSSLSPSCEKRYNEDNKIHVRERFGHRKIAERNVSHSHKISTNKNSPKEEMNVAEISNDILESERAARKTPGFGLQNVPLKSGLDSLGPSKEVLERKRKEKEASLEKKRPAQKIQAITAEERAILLAKMQSDAEVRKSSLDKIVQKPYDDQ